MLLRWLARFAEAALCGNQQELYVEQLRICPTGYRSANIVVAKLPERGLQMFELR